jgi:hypothetical protein
VDWGTPPTERGIPPVLKAAAPSRPGIVKVLALNLA